MAKKNNAPNKAELEQLAASLRPGQRVKAGTGIYLTRDGDGRLRFQWRARVGGRRSRNAGRTCDSYEEAQTERGEALARKHDSSSKRRERGRKMTIEQVFDGHWWPHVLTLADNTQLDYGSAWDNDIYPYFKGMTLEALLELDDWQDWDTWLRKRHTKADGTLARSALEKAYNVLGRIFNFAVEEHLLAYNPVEAVQSKRRRRDQEARRKAARKSEERVVLRSEIPSPLEVERIRLWLPGRHPLERQMRRALISVLAWAWPAARRGPAPALAPPAQRLRAARLHQGAGRPEGHRRLARGR